MVRGGSVVWSALLGAAGLLSADSSATSQPPGNGETSTVGAEYVVHPDIHPLERIQQWTAQIEKNNGSASAAGTPWAVMVRSLYGLAGWLNPSASLHQPIAVVAANAIDFMNRGVAFQEQGQNEETEAMLIEQRRKVRRRLPRLSSGSSSLWLRLWATRAWFQEAEADYGKAIELDPTNPAVYYNLGTLKRRQSRWVEAASAFLQANQNAPGNFHALAMTGRCAPFRIVCRVGAD
jgi:tetratricopeptide (TPR) repeat protein